MLNILTDAIGLTDFHNERVARKDADRNARHANELTREIVDLMKVDNSKFEQITMTIKSRDLEISELKENMQSLQSTITKLKSNYADNYEFEEQSSLDPQDPHFSKLDREFNKLNAGLDKLEAVVQSPQNKSELDEMLENAYSENTNSDFL